MALNSAAVGLTEIVRFLLSTLERVSPVERLPLDNSEHIDAEKSNELWPFDRYVCGALKSMYGRFFQQTYNEMQGEWIRTVDAV
jgi:hypothetical protein